MIMETNNEVHRLRGLCGIVDNLRYTHDYEQLKEFYNELLEKGLIKPIEYFIEGNRIEDEMEELLMFKFYLAFEDMKRNNK